MKRGDEANDTLVQATGKQVTAKIFGKFICLTLARQNGLS